MGRARNLRLWSLALWAACLVAATSAHLEPSRDAAVPGALPAATGIFSQTPGTAVLPARIAEEARAAGQAAPSRVLVLAAVLALLVGLPAMPRRRLLAGGQGSRPLRSRRHTIALRAPPLQFA